MARPKTGRPAKKGMCLTVSDETREQLAFISAYYGKSISALVSEYAEREATKCGCVLGMNNLQGRRNNCGVDE